jgi:hypothetical protein
MPQVFVQSAGELVVLRETDNREQKDQKIQARTRPH